MLKVVRVDQNINLVEMGTNDGFVMYDIYVNNKKFGTRQIKAPLGVTDEVVKQCFDLQVQIATSN